MTMIESQFFFSSRLLTLYSSKCTIFERVAYFDLRTERSLKVNQMLENNSNKNFSGQWELMVILNFEGQNHIL